MIEPRTQGGGYLAMEVRDEVWVIPHRLVTDPLVEILRGLNRVGPDLDLVIDEPGFRALTALWVDPDFFRIGA